MKSAIKPGSKFLYQGSVVRIIRLLDLDKVEIEDSNKNILPVSRKSLAQIPSDASLPKASNEIFTLSDKEYTNASKRWEIIRPMIDAPGDGELVKKIATAHDIPITTLYRWAKTYREAGTIESLAEGRGKPLDGRKLLDEKLENIIAAAIKEKYLTPYRKSITAVIEEVELQCHNKKLAPPHRNTIRKRIHEEYEKDEREVMKKRRGGPKASDHFDPKTGSFPDPIHALEVVQVDHTPLDVIVVDPVYRRPIKGRPILTTVMDVVTKMVLGYYLSFMKPGFVNAGLCISNMILPKDAILKRLKIPGSWPCWGKPSIIYMDNAKEFRGNSMKRACEKNKITIQWRPRKKPRFGGNIEALQKTLNMEIHKLPGTTFFNTQKRGEYDSEKMAALTFDEVEAFLVDFIVNRYHQRVHPVLLRPPIAVWKEQLVGSPSFPGIGYQEEPDEEHVKIDFLPSFLRTVQNYGVSHEGITYFSNYLKRYIKKTDDTRKKLKEFEFRWDPRDLSCIHLLDPAKKDFVKVDLANIQFRNVNANIWEYKAMMRELKAQGLKEVDEVAIFKSLARRNKLEEKAIDETKKAQAAHKKAKKQNSETKSPPKKAVDEDDPFSDLDIDSIKPLS